MLTKIEAIWQEEKRKATQKPIDTNDFRLTLVDATAKFAIYGGLDASNFVMLAIGVTSRPPQLSTNSGSLDYFRHKRGDGKWLMVLRLRQPGLEAVFGRLCQDLIDATDGVSDEPALLTLFKDRLNLWKKLFQKGGAGLLEGHEIRGLLGELLFLKMLLVKGERSASSAVTAWVGPLGANQDFVFPSSAFEVKAIRPDSEAVSIASLEQLESNVPLTLVTIELISAATGDAGVVSLNSLTTEIESMLAIDAGALDLYKVRLLEAHYVENEFYETILFTAGQMNSFEVKAGFPRLLFSTVPTGIVSSSYSISIESIKPFIIQSDNYGK